MENRNLLPNMISVSRNCRLTIDLHKALIEKFSESELRDFQQWLQVVSQEKDNDKNRNRWKPRI